VSERVDAVVIGAGVVGLAVARALALAGREVLVLEAADAIGTEISSRNSEVIHAGLYYPPGSIKARTCVAGRDMLYRYAAARHVPHRRCGKLIIAVDPAEREALARLAEQGRASGVADLRLLDAADVAALEPDLACTAGLLSPSSGIIDSHALMLALQGDAENAGALFAFRAPVLGGHAGDAGITLEVGGAQPFTLAARTVVNAAGLHAPGLARRIHGIRTGSIPQQYFAKGQYMTFAGRTPFAHLVYPVPVPGGLGIHLTLDLAGKARFGPDVEWVDAPDYEVDPGRIPAFEAAIRRYWPGLPGGALQPGYAGVRPKIAAPNAPAADFMIQGPAEHGLAGLINLFGIESPGLTASLALAQEVLVLTDALSIPLEPEIC